jgi:hypothetical protein
MLIFLLSGVSALFNRVALLNLEKHMNKNGSSTFTVSRCTSAVTTSSISQQQNRQKHAVAAPAKTSYRKSSVSGTVRCPNELLPKVRALIEAYRQQHQNDPDRW